MRIVPAAFNVADPGNPLARVTVTQTDTGATRTAQTEGEGTYILSNLPIGPYRMEVKKDGFSTYIQSGIVHWIKASPYPRRYSEQATPVDISGET